jgi:uncharacterized RDD family membrane protein YckC
MSGGFLFIIAIANLTTMTRDQHLVYCKVCRNRSFNSQYGIVCGLTNEPANFDPTCPDFKAEAGAEEPLTLELQAFMGSSVDVQSEMASGGKRFLNYVIDIIIVYILVFVIALVLAVVLSLSSPDALASFERDTASTKLFDYLMTAFVMVCYYMFMESVFGCTIGKLVTGTRVVNKNGKTPDTYTIFLRSLSRLVPFEAFSFLGADARGWHDRWTDTWVINKKS